MARVSKEPPRFIHEYYTREEAAEALTREIQRQDPKHHPITVKDVEKLLETGVLNEVDYPDFNARIKIGFNEYEPDIEERTGITRSSMVEAFYLYLPPAPEEPEPPAPDEKEAERLRLLDEYAALPDNALVRIETIAAILGCRVVTVRRRLKNRSLGLNPEPRSSNREHIKFKKRDVEAWQDNWKRQKAKKGAL